MSARKSLGITFAQINRSLRTKLLPLNRITVAAVMLGMVAVTTSKVQAQAANIIDSLTENISQAGYQDVDGDASGCAQLENTTSFVRAGVRAFKHVVDKCGKRSELEIGRTSIGGTYWQGWSMYIPTSWVNSSEWYDIVTQWATYPTNKDFTKGCGAVGSYMVISSDILRLHLQHKGDTSDIECDKYTLGNINDMKGKWVDFVMQAKWTGDTDGFFKLWMKVGNGAYVQVVNHTGRTFWNDEDRGPYFKMGLYKGSTNWDGPGAPRILYTDEYRLGNANSSFDDFVLDGSSRPRNIRLEAESLALSAYRIEENTSASGNSLISLRYAGDNTDTASATFTGKSGNYDVYLGYYDENDGEANIQVTVGGVSLANLSLDQNLPANHASAATFVRKKLASNFSINQGARIQLEGTANQEEWARVDYIEFVPVP